SILLPVDYSEPCEAVVPYASEFLTRFRSQLLLVHGYGWGAARGATPINDPQLLSNLEQTESARLADFAAQNFPGWSAITVAEYGSPETVVQDSIRKYGADLIMLATHGHGPLREFLMGSVASKILHDVDCAVWIAPGPVLTASPHRVPYRKIL